MELRDIKGFEGRYVVSEYGNIFSLYDFAGRRQFAEKVQGTDRYGYKYVMLYRNGKRKHMTVHRAVACAYLENPNKYPQVNHIDGNKENNHISNLEWCSVSHNIRHAYDNGLNHPHQSPWKGCDSGKHPRAKKVIARKNGETYVYDSAVELSKVLGVSKCCVAMAISRGNKCKGWDVTWMNEQ